MDFTGERMIPKFNKEEGLIYGEHMVRYIFASQFVKDKKILDIATGSGYGSHLLAKAGAKEVVGVDISEESIVFAKENYKHKNCTFIVSNAEKIEMEDNSFDMVVSFETIEHLPHYERFLNEVKRVLKEDGVFIVSTPNKKKYPAGNPYHIKEFYVDEFESELQKFFEYIHVKNQDNFLTSALYADFSNKDLLTEVNSDIDLEPLYVLAICSNSDIDFSQYKDLNYVTSTDNLVSKLQEHVANLENAQVEAVKYIAGLETHAKNLEESLKHKLKHNEEMETQIRNLELLLSEHVRNNKELEKHTKNLEESLSNQKQHTKNLEENLSNQEKHTKNLEESLCNKEEHNLGLLGHVKHLENELHEKGSLINDQGNKLQDLQKNVDNLSVHLDSINKLKLVKLLKKIKLI